MIALGKTTWQPRWVYVVFVGKGGALIGDWSEVRCGG